MLGTSFIYLILIGNSNRLSDAEKAIFVYLSVRRACVFVAVMKLAEKGLILCFMNDLSQVVFALQINVQSCVI